MIVDRKSHLISMLQNVHALRCPFSFVIKPFICLLLHIDPNFFSTFCHIWNAHQEIWALIKYEKLDFPCTPEDNKKKSCLMLLTIVDWKDIWWYSICLTAYIFWNLGYMPHGYIYFIILLRVKRFVKEERSRRRVFQIIILALFTYTNLYKARVLNIHQKEENCLWTQIYNLISLKGREIWGKKRWVLALNFHILCPILDPYCSCWAIFCLFGTITHNTLLLAFFEIDDV